MSGRMEFLMAVGVMVYELIVKFMMVLGETSDHHCVRIVTLPVMMLTAKKGQVIAVEQQGPKKYDTLIA